jgi:hypothetical protein
VSAAGANRRHVFLGHLNRGPLVDVEEHIADEDLLAQFRGAVFHQVLDLVASNSLHQSNTNVAGAINNHRNSCRHFCLSDLRQQADAVEEVIFFGSI